MEEKPTMGNIYLTLNENHAVLKISSEGEGDAGFVSFIEKNFQDMAFKEPIPDHLFVKVDFRDKNDIPHMLHDDPDRFVNQLIPLLLGRQMPLLTGEKNASGGLRKKARTELYA